MKPILRRDIVLDAFGIISLVLIMKGVFDRALNSMPAMYLPTGYPDVAAKFDQYSFSELLLPLADMNGAWSTTGHILIYWLQSTLGSIPTYLLLNTATALVLYAVGLATTRSRLFSVSVAVAFSTSTFNYHVYLNSGTTGNYPFIIFGALTLCSQAMYVRSITPGRRLLTLAAMLLSAAALALTYEGWLDIVPWLVVVSPVAWWYAKQQFGSQAGRRYIESVILWLIVAFVYLGILTNPAYMHSFQPGSEQELIVTYINQFSLAPFVDDLVSNVFTFFYAAFSTLLPPGVGESITLFRHSRPEIDGFMQGYHAPFNHLVYPHYVYLWRYFAGAAFAMAAVLAWKSARRTFQDADTPAFLLFVGLMALLLGSPTHDLIKFRPYNATPFLGYKSVFAVAGLFVALGAMALMVERRVRSSKARISLFSLACAYLVAIGITRPVSLQVSSRQTQMGDYPQPLHTLEILLDCGRLSRVSGVDQRWLCRR